MEPVIVVREPEKDEINRVNEALLMKIKERTEREEEIKNSLLMIIMCQINNILSDIFNKHELKMVALRIDNSLRRDLPYHWETIFLFVVPGKYDYKKISDLFSKVEIPRVGGWIIPDELKKWNAAINIYRNGYIKLDINGDTTCKTITEKIKSIFKENSKITIMS